ncbi:MAG: SRPBCC domain-containing protein [Planctomycetota bacterium]
MADRVGGMRAVGAFGALLAWMAGGCAGVPAAGTDGNALPAVPGGADVINWPEAYRPEDAVFFVHNEIEIDAPPESVWRSLIDAERWPSWYRGATGVRVEGGEGGHLALGSEISWRTMDQDFVSRVIEFEPPYRLSWESRKGSIQGYHAWLIVPTGTGSRVITDESQHGFLAHMQKLFLPNKLRLLHDEWLTGLKARVEASE